MLTLKEFQDKYQVQLSQWRQYLHAYPELSWLEHKTTDYIVNSLKEIGIQEIERPLETGVIAYIRGQKESNRVVALRADIDGLPINEKNTCSYKSKNEGVMHACGHDVHTTCLLGAAKYLFEHLDELSGTIILIFQPSEEKQPSGAEAIMKTGILQKLKPEYILGLHVTPELEVGKLGFRSGPFMASADEIYLSIIGKGGHGASPHLCIDPIVISANIIVALQQLISRYTDPKIPTVLSFGDIHGYGATNIIPDRVDLKGTLRTFDQKWRLEIQEKIKSVCHGIAESFGGKCELNIPQGIPSVANNLEVTTRIQAIASKIFGENNVIEMPIRMGAEDFSYYGLEFPSSFFRLGTGNINMKSTTIPVHNPMFDIDEKALSIGAYAMASFAKDGTGI